MDISILNDKFLQTFKDRPQENLRLKLLEKLVRDEIQRRQKSNLAKAKSFREMLEATLQRYHNRLIDAAAVIKVLIRIRKEMEEDELRAKRLNLQPEELAFFDAVAQNYANIFEQKFLCDLIHEIVETIKRNLKVDWTQPHREDVKAAVRAAVKMVMRKKKVKKEHIDPLLDEFMTQAEALYADWPIAA